MEEYAQYVQIIDQIANIVQIQLLVHNALQHI